MEEKKLKINIPEGHEIDKEKSTFEEIVFKKVNPLSELPEGWEEYCEQTKTAHITLIVLIMNLMLMKQQLMDSMVNFQPKSEQSSLLHLVN